ncbi:MAG: DUF308 domain-containing protein [Rhodospirillales bacterium]|nr:DUF308 domain-containing protein [Rhodospirillales bacterium]
MSEPSPRIAPDLPLLRSAALARNWWAMLIRGIAAVAFGIIAFLLPVQAVTVLALLFGVYLLVDGVFVIVAAIAAATHHTRWGLLLLEGAIDIVVGLLALAAPGAVILGVVWVTAGWAIVTGGLMLAAAFRLHGGHGNWLLGLGGLVSIVWGVLLWLWPLFGAIVLTIWLGAYAVIFGAALIAFALRLRRRHLATMRN